ncbi:MAG: V-type ATP synthase subunit E [Erysipelotrichaceae bacterium]|nr:V-type ATP synthase subunit E [Erysipelotrichaceae bacterium]MDY5251808.1 V-type ATP synthase subunit E [Erysipelotrichaceae bacterium]
MADEKEIMKIITDDVNDQAALVIDQIQKEVTSTKEDQINFYKMGLKKETDTYLEKELNELRILAVTQTSQAKLQTKRDLLNLRSELVDKLFDDVLSELKAFVESDKYSAYLKTKIKSLNVSNGYFKIRKEDEELFNKILKELALSNKYEIKPIMIGGFRYVDLENNIEYDLTLDNSLKEQKSWFQRESKFTI